MFPNILTPCLPVSYSWSPLGNASRTINTYWRAFNVKGNGTLVGEGFEVRWLAPPTRAFNSFYLEAEFRFLYIRFFHSFSTSYSCVARGFYNFNSNNKFVCEGGRQRRRRLKNSWYVIFLDRTTKKALKKKFRTFFVVIESNKNKNRFGKTLFLGTQTFFYHHLLRYRRKQEWPKATLLHGLC